MIIIDLKIFSNKKTCFKFKKKKKDHLFFNDKIAKM